MRKIVSVAIILLCFCAPAVAADVTLQWDPVVGADGYRIYISTDCGQTWDYNTGTDVGNVTVYVYEDVPDTGQVLFRAGAYNGHGEEVEYKAGVSWCGDCGPPAAPRGIGIQ